MYPHPAKKGLVILAWLILVVAPVALAQDSLRVIDAQRVNGKIKIDGDLSDSSWLEVQPFTGHFYQIQPDNGALSAYQSKVFVAYDNRAIYVGALLYDPDPQSIPRELGIRDNLNVNVDAFAFTIDPLNNGLNGFSYIVTAAGVQADAIIGNRGFDTNWNAVWKSEVSITGEGWVVEMEIPYSAIRFPNSENQVWGVNFYRASKRLNEEATWNFVNQEVEGFLNQSGRMEGLHNIKPPLRLSFLPYLSLGGEYNSSNKTFARSFAGGMDMKLGISESFTLDMSLVPDFSQVQSDNVVLNLSPFEVRYDEYRPFFTEGVELFSKGGIFYSRRIGQVRGFVDDNDLQPTERVIEFPASTQLINATKLSGRTAGGTGLGFFNAITDNAYAVLENNGEVDQHRNYLVEPRTNFNVMVVDQNLKNNSYIGLINTNVIRQGDYRDANVTVADFQFRDQTNTWSFSGSGGLSQIFTVAEEGRANSMGFRTRAYFSKVSGKFQFSTGLRVESDQWDINDLGFMRQNNQMVYSGRVSYNIYKPFSVFNRLSTRLRLKYEQLYRPRTYTGAGIGGGVSAQFRNFYDVGIGFNVNPFANYDYFEPREPGYYFKTGPNYNVYAYVGTDSRKKLSLGMNVGAWYRPDDNARVMWIGAGPSFRVSNRLNLGYNLNLSIARDTKGFVTKIYDSQGALDNIIFGLRDQNTVTNTLDLNYTFTNKMGVNFRMRHYWSWVEHPRFYDLTTDGELVDSNYTGLDENGLPMHNTTFNAFNIDMVYSWEVAPGSFFTVIWKNQIYAYSGEAQKGFVDNLSETFAANGVNTLTMKLVYYIDIAYFRKKAT